MPREKKSFAVQDEKNSLIHTARSDFPSSMNESHFLQQSTARRDKSNDNGGSFIAQNKFVVAQGVTVTLDDGKILRYHPGQQPGSHTTSRSSQDVSQRGTDEIYTAEINLTDNPANMSYQHATHRYNTIGIDQ